jgi:hypothetical protein
MLISRVPLSSLGEGPTLRQCRRRQTEAGTRSGGRGARRHAHQIPRRVIIRRGSPNQGQPRRGSLVHRRKGGGHGSGLARDDVARQFHRRARRHDGLVFDSFSEGSNETAAEVIESTGAIIMGRQPSVLALFPARCTANPHGSAIPSFPWSNLIGTGSPLPGLSRRRSRVRVPSLPALKVPANRQFRNLGCLNERNASLYGPNP